MIDELDVSIQQRLLNPLPNTLGMSRIMVRPSLGEHFLPVITDARDFAPENDRERKALAALEDRKVQVGLYLFGERILREDAGALSFRALKGPGSITIDTPRPKWYPFGILGPSGSPRSAADVGITAADCLPDWIEIYPVAQRAMRSFKDGGKGFETEFQGWTIAARPALAASLRCVSCHNSVTPGSAKLGEAVGGVLYACRGADKSVETRSH